MRLLFLSGWYPPRSRGGAEVSCHLLAQGLRERGHDVHVVAAGERREQSVFEGVPVQRLLVPLTAKPLLERHHSRRLARKLAREVQLISYDFLHAHDFRSALVLAEMPEISVPRVWTVRDYASICGTTNAVLRDGSRCTCSWRDVVRTQRVAEASWARKPFRVWQYKYNIGYRRSALGNFPRQVYISHAQRAEIARQLALPDVADAVIYNPVPPEYLASSAVPGVRGNVLYAGTVEDYKGAGLLLQAWREVARRLPEAKLTFVGDGAQRMAYELMVERWGLQYRVRFAGRLEQARLRHYYDESSVVVAPALWVEPFGRTVAEAMARGKVVVAANSGGPSELLAQGQTGLLFERGSETALVKQLTEALTLPALKRRGIEQAARQWAREHLSADVIARQYEKYYTNTRYQQAQQEVRAQ